MPNSFSRFLNDEELQDFRRQYMEFLAEGGAEPEVNTEVEDGADPSRLQERDQ
jgi:hypothetical protein